MSVELQEKVSRAIPLWRDLYDGTIDVDDALLELDELDGAEPRPPARRWRQWAEAAVIPTLSVGGAVLFAHLVESIDHLIDVPPFHFRTPAFPVFVAVAAAGYFGRRRQCWQAPWVAVLLCVPALMFALGPRGLWAQALWLAGLAVIAGCSSDRGSYFGPPAPPRATRRRCSASKIRNVAGSSLSELVSSSE